MKKIFIPLFFILFTFGSCDVLQQQLQNTIVLSESDIVNGLKEALKVGTNNSVSVLGIAGGFYNNEKFRIPFPQEAQKAETKLRELGMGEMVDKFIKTMNDGAENAVSKATPIFVNAITSMTIQDAKNILKGNDDAATVYFKSKTQTQLFDLFKPEVKKALDAVNATKYWTDIISTYNKIPLVTKIETDLAKYVTNKAIDALFVKIAEEEKQIRTDPAKRVNEILKKVFNPNAIVQ